MGYAEGAGRAVYLENRDDVRAYTLRFGILTEQSLSPAATVKLIIDVAQGYDQLLKENPR